MMSTHQILCPRCKGILQPSSASQMRCPADGSTYQVLYSRFPVASAAAPVAQAPGQPIPGAHYPGQPVAPQASPGYPPMGGQPLPPPPGVPSYATAPAVAPVMPVVAGQPVGVAGTAAPAAPVVQQAQPVAALPAPLPDGSTCVQHGGAAAICRCSKCAAPACATCAFWLPNDLVLCPSCVTSTRKKGLSRRRKIFVGWSLGLAAFASVMPLLGMLVAFSIPEEEVAAGLAGIAILSGLFPATVGLGMGAGAISWGKSNPPVPWICTLWNGLIVAAGLLVTIAGIVFG